MKNKFTDRWEDMKNKLEANGCVFSEKPVTPLQARMIRRFQRKVNKPDPTLYRQAMGMAQQYKHIMKSL